MTLLRKAKSDILFGNSVYIFLTRFFPVLATLLVQIFYSRQLTQNMYGGYQNFWVQLYLFAAIACAGIHVFIITYPPGFVVRLIYRTKPKYLLYIISWLTIVCLAFGLFQSERHLPTSLAFAFLFAHAISAIAESFLIVFKKTKLLALVNLLYAAAFGFIHYIILRSDFLLSSLFFYILILVVIKLFVYLFCIYSFAKQNKKAAFEEELATTGIGSLWLHMGLYDLLNILARWSDKFIVSLLLVQSVSGVYFNGAVDIPFIPLIVGAAGSAILIELANKNDKTEPAYTIALANRSAKLLSAIVFPLFFFFMLFREELFDVVFTSKFSEAVPIFLASCLTIPLRAYSFTTVLQNRNKGALINAGAVLDLVIAFSLIYPLYQILGLAGIALSFSLATYAQAAFYLYHTSKTLQVPVLTLFPYNNWLKKLIIFAMAFIVTHYLSDIYLSDLQTLTLGFVTTAIVIIVSLALELKRSQHDAAT